MPIRLINAALLALLAVTIAHAFWALAAPPVRPLPPAPLTESARLAGIVHAARLFGVPVQSVQGEAGAPAHLALVGVLATRKGGGTAVISINGARPQTVRAGTEVHRGLRLERVLRDHVIVSESGRERRIELQRVRRTAVAPVTAPARRP